MNIEQTLENLTKDTDIYFHDTVTDKHTTVAKSHFFDLHFGPTYVEVVNSYTLPGPKLKGYLVEVLPFRIDYIVDNCYTILVETLSEIQQNCIGAEYKDEFEE